MAYVNSVPCSRSTNNTGGGFAGLGRGLGCAACGGKCGQAGLGIFDSGLDITQWGWPEWTAVGIGAYLVLSIGGDVGRAGRAVGSARSSLQARAARRAKKRKLLAEANAL